MTGDHLISENREKKLKELATIIAEAPIPMFVIDRHHRITHFNKACEELTGYTGAEMIGTDNQWKAFYSHKRPVMADFIVDQSSEEELKKYYNLKYDRDRPGQARYCAEDFFPDFGENGKWLFFTAAPITDENGALLGAVETLQDISEEKRAQQEMAESYRHYRMLLEFVPYPIVVYDNQGYVSYLNSAFTQTFGWTLSELKGQLVPFVPEELGRETKALIKKFFREKSLTRYETQRLTRDGRVLDVVMWATAFSRHGEKADENFVILRDITEEKRIAANNKTIMRISTALPEHPELEELMNYISREVKEMLNTEGALVLIYDEIKDEVFFLGASYDDSDREKRVKEVRFTLDEVLAGKVIRTGESAVANDPSICDQYPERDRKLGYKTETLLVVPVKSEGRIIGALCAINKKKGRFVDNDTELLNMIAGTAAISIENARFSEELKKAYKELSLMNRAKDKAINHLSHELKTPVAVLSGSIRTLRSRLETLENNSLENAVQRIERNLDRIVQIQSETADIMENKAYSAKRVLLRMLDACRDELEALIEANIGPDNLVQSVRDMIDEKFGPVERDLKKIDIPTFLNAFYGELTQKYAFRKIETVLSINEDVPYIYMPYDILKKIVEGLVKNAVENTPDNQQIRIGLKKGNGGALLEVLDYGVGIEEDNRKTIFGGFFSTQTTLLYTTKTPFEFNAGGKGADLLRMKIFSEQYGFKISMASSRCRYLLENTDYSCPGDTEKCRYIRSSKECQEAGHSLFSVFFPCV